MYLVTRAGIERLLSASPIAELAAERGIELRPLGPELLVGRCPRHAGAVGRSLLVERVSGRFRCLVCGLRGGNAIGLVMHTDALPFLPAVLKLAGRAGLDLDALLVEPARLEPAPSEVPEWALTPPVGLSADVVAHVCGEASC
ncbi:MAG: CHC2 zinc finger domain-containing protein [Thermoanaerobaculaceae bacterium]|jgi:DNA primase|nr:CHC2 zinc finger domain-containing protein [Thermoanaerobaculaceae bacterium]